MTGIGGFLQEFLYGYSGLRWQGSAVHLSPGLSGPITGVTLRDLSWRGRTFMVAIHRDGATVTLDSGAPPPISTPSGRATVRAGHPVTIVTPGATASHANPDPLLCGAASASNTAPGAPALAAVDGSNATDWQDAQRPADRHGDVPSDARPRCATAGRWNRREHGEDEDHTVDADLADGPGADRALTADWL